MSCTMICLDTCGLPGCKLAGLKAHADHQNLKRVTLHGIIAYVGLDHQKLHRFTPFLLQWYLFNTRTPYHQKLCKLEWWMACCEKFCGEKLGSRSGRSGISALIGYNDSQLLWSLPFEIKSSWSQCGHAHSGNIWKTPPIWGSDSPLCKNDGFYCWRKFPLRTQIVLCGAEHS